MTLQLTTSLSPCSNTKGIRWKNGSGSPKHSANTKTEGHLSKKVLLDQEQRIKVVTKLDNRFRNAHNNSEMGDVLILNTQHARNDSSMNCQPYLTFKKVVQNYLCDKCIQDATAESPRQQSFKILKLSGCLHRF